MRGTKKSGRTRRLCKQHGRAGAPFCKQHGRRSLRAWPRGAGLSLFDFRIRIAPVSAILRDPPLPRPAPADDAAKIPLYNGAAQRERRMSYIPPQTPKQRAENRARILRAALWLAALPPLLFIVMAFGYSDQSPAWLRSATVQLDAMFGQPVWSIIAPPQK